MTDRLAKDRGTGIKPHSELRRPGQQEEIQYTTEQTNKSSRYWPHSEDDQDNEKALST